MIQVASVGSGKWGWSILCRRDLVEPSVKVFLTEFVNVRMTVDFDVVASLSNVDAVEHVE